MRALNPTASTKLWVSAPGQCRAVRSIDPTSDPLNQKRTITHMKLNGHSDVAAAISGALDFADSDDKTPRKIGRPSI